MAEASLAEVKQAVDQQGRAFEEYKKAIDQKVTDLEKKGTVDPTLVEKIEKLEKELGEGKAEEISQQLIKEQNERKNLEEHVAELETQLKRLPAGGGKGDPDLDRKAKDNQWLRAAAKAITHGADALDQDERKALSQANDEAKALSVSQDSTGGYLARPEFVREMIRSVTEISPVRSMVRVRQTGQRSLMLPKRTGQFSAQWVAEQGSRTETTGLTFGLQEVPTHELYALVDISEQNLEDSEFDMEAFVREEATEQFAVAEGQAVVTGNAVGKPEGWQTNSDVSSTISGDSDEIRDTRSGQAEGDGLIRLYHDIKTAYARNAMWALNRNTLSSVRSLKTADNAYVWQPGNLAAGIPNQILGAPYMEVPDMPDEGANTFPIAFGDFRRAYTMVDRVQMSMLRDPFTQATSGNIRFIFRRRLGGQVVLAEAIRKLKCAAS